jgi:beta-1,4-N-acetylglucosaminyltransferase
MIIFVTVGHTRFNSLFKMIDSFNRPEWHFISQISDGDVHPHKGEVFAYTDDIQSFYKKADVVITHAGAGSVFSLLELSKPTIVVANTDRVDKHQNDLLDYVENSHFAQVCRDLRRLEGLIGSMASFQENQYSNEMFNAANDIADVLGLLTLAKK